MKMSPQYRLIENDMITLYHRSNGLAFESLAPLEQFKINCMEKTA